MARGKLTARSVETERHPGAPDRPIKVSDGNGLFLEAARTILTQAGMAGLIGASQRERW